MLVKLLQLNIYKGKFLPHIIDFVAKNGVQICQFQEVAGGAVGFEGSDNFHELKDRLDFKGELIRTVNQKEPEGYFGNATLFRNEIKLIEKKIVWLKDYDPNFILGQGDSTQVPRAALVLKLQIRDKVITFINAHLTRTLDPHDSEQKLAESQRLVEFMRNLSGDFILSGDFNVVPDTQIVRSFEYFGENLTRKFGLKNTLNPKEHYLGQKVLDYNLAVDYIFVSPHIQVKNFQLLDHRTLSDHYGLLLEFDL